MKCNMSEWVDNIGRTISGLQVVVIRDGLHIHGMVPAHAIRVRFTSVDHALVVEHV